MDCTQFIDGNSSRYNGNKVPICIMPPTMRTVLMSNNPTISTIKALELCAIHSYKGTLKYPDVEYDTVKFPNYVKGQYFKTMLLDSITRHIYLYQTGEKLDKETGSHHYISAIWGLGVLYHQFYNYSIYKHLDDRNWQGFTIPSFTIHSIFEGLQLIEMLQSPDDNKYILASIITTVKLLADFIYDDLDENERPITFIMETTTNG